MWKLGGRQVTSWMVLLRCSIDNKVPLQQQIFDMDAALRFSVGFSYKERPSRIGDGLAQVVLPDGDEILRSLGDGSYEILGEDSALNSFVAPRVIGHLSPPTARDYGCTS